MKGNKLVSPAYFLRGADPWPIVVGDLHTYLDAIGGQDVPMTVDTLIIVHQLFLTGISGAVLSMRYIPPTAPLHQWWEATSLRSAQERVQRFQQLLFAPVRRPQLLNVSPPLGRLPSRAHRTG